MIARVPIERSIYEFVLKGRRSCRIGRRYESVFPEPVWDCMNASRGEVESPRGNSAKSDARCIEVGFEISILVVRCVVMRGFRPSPVNVEESVRGALLGLLGPFGTDVVGLFSTFGLEENSEDMICVGWRGLRCPCTVGTDVIGRSLESFRGRFGGRLSSSTLKRAFACEAF